MNNPKFHLSLDVKNIEGSARFYSFLFDTTPTKRKAGYAKFDLDQPAVNLTLNEATPCCITGLSHMGIRVDSTAEVFAARQRLEAAGLATFEETNTTCCYAVQDKIWVTDPTGYRWEVYVFKGDSEQVADTAHELAVAAGAPCSSTECVPREAQPQHSQACCKEQAALNAVAGEQNQGPQACCTK